MLTLPRGQAILKANTGPGLEEVTSGPCTSGHQFIVTKVAGANYATLTVRR